MGISNAVDAGVVSRTLGIKTEQVNFNAGRVVFLPQRVALIGQGNTAATYPAAKRQVTSHNEVGALYGYGSPLHLAAMQLLPDNNDGLRSIPLTVFPLSDADRSQAAAGTIEAAGDVTTQRTIRILVAGQQSNQIVLTVGMTATQVAAAIIVGINGVLTMPVTAVIDNTDDTQVNITAKWAGTSGNDITLSLSGASDSGTTLAFVQPTNGAADPDVQTALDQIGEVWETLVVNCNSTANDTALDTFETFGEGRWGPLLHRPLTVFTGTAETTANTLAAIGDARRAQRVNSIESVPGSRNLPCELAAAVVSRVARVANNNPARDYARQALPFIEPGLDSVQWNAAQREQLVQAGISTTIVRDSVVEISDTVTTYHPTGLNLPGYRFVKSITKLANTIFNVDLIFNTENWDGAPLIPDDQPTTNSDAKRPKDAVAVLSTLAYNLGLNAIISDVDFTLENLRSTINDQNPDRLDTRFPVKVSGNVGVQSIDLDFGFFLGTQEVIA